ncbi:MAG: hypothetical protein HOP17_01445 [Acidobacteria bacterium]|nr:hypothetical protein [Acidobacteriota bacterium]
MDTVRIGEKGHSLIELVIAMLIFMIVSGAIWGLMRVAQQSRTAINQQVPLSKDARVALNILGRDTFNAGFGYPLKSTVVLPDNRVSTLLGVPNDTDVLRDTVPPVIAGNDITLNTFNTTAGVRTDQVTFLFKDTTFNPVGVAPDQFSQSLNINAATTTGTGIDEIVPISGSNSSCRVNDIYLVTGNTGSTLGLATGLSGADRVQFSNGDLLGINLTGAGGSLIAITLPASMQRVLMVTYFVTPDGTLTRREFGNAPGTSAFVDEPLVYGVENFQVQYVMENGSLTDNPSAGPDLVAGTGDDVLANLEAVRQIRFTISLRTNELDSRGQPSRVTMSSTFSTRNLGYDAS